MSAWKIKITSLPCDSALKSGITLSNFSFNLKSDKKLCDHLTFFEVFLSFIWQNKANYISFESENYEKNVSGEKSNFRFIRRGLQRFLI